MNIKYTVTIICFAIFTLGSNAIAQTFYPPNVAEQIPSGPLILSKAPDTAQWTVTHTTVSWDIQKSDTDKQNPKFVETGKDEFSKSQNLRHVIYNKAPNFHVEIWIKDNHEFFFRPDLKGPIYTPLETPNNPYKIELDRDFPDFDWICEKNFIGIKKLENREYLYFDTSKNNKKFEHTAMSVRGTEGEYDVYKSPNIAFIDLETRLPLIIKEGNEMMAYKFSDSPKKISLPTDLQARLDAMEKKERKIRSMPGRPY